MFQMYLILKDNKAPSYPDASPSPGPPGETCPALLVWSACPFSGANDSLLLAVKYTTSFSLEASKRNTQPKNSQGD